MYTSFQARFEQRSRSDSEAAVLKAENFYRTSMAEHFDPGKPCFDSIEEKHEISHDAAIKVFVDEPKMGGEITEFRDMVSYLLLKQT